MYVHACSPVQMCLRSHVHVRMYVGRYGGAARGQLKVHFFRIIVALTVLEFPVFLASLRVRRLFQALSDK